MKLLISKIKSIRIFIKYLRKFLSGLISITPFVKINSNQYPFNKENRTLGDDWMVIGQDLNFAIHKYNKNNKQNLNERK